ncbi:hypothetical protein P7C70_g7290, partial [Phenoliferia sp. Uapishka_3]
MSDTAVFIKKRKGAPGGIRKRPADSPPPSADTPSTSEVKYAPKKAIANHLIQGTNKRSRTTDPSTSGLALSDSDDDDPTSSSFVVRHSAGTSRPRRRSSSPPAEMSAPIVTKVEEEVRDDGIYRGASGQAHKLPKAFGPVKGGPGNVRTITVVDYQPDVCKDYKGVFSWSACSAVTSANSLRFHSETGFCGFGDTCKFLHDRGDYLHGWQLDNSFLSSTAAAGSFMAKQNARENGGGGGDDSDSDNEDLPFACLICRKPFGKETVVTLCGHYFDSACAIKRFGKTGKCFACGKGTNGVFNKATKLIAKQKEREKIAEADAAQEREFEEDDDGGIEIEGLDRVESAAPEPVATGGDVDGDDSEEEAAAPKKVRRRPIIEIEEARERR